MEFFSFILVISVFAGLWIYWHELPEKVPTHYGFGGEPDRWGTKSSMLILPFTTLAMWLLLTFAAKYNKLINLPINVNRDHPTIQRAIVNFSIVLKLVIVGTMAFLCMQTLRVAKGEATGIGSVFLVLIGVATVLVLVLYMGKLQNLQKQIEGQS